MRRFSVILMSLAICLLSSMSLWATTSKEEVKAKIEETIAQLDLSEQQKFEITPVLEKYYQDQQAVLEKYDLDKDSRDSGNTKKPEAKTIRDIRSDMGSVRQETQKNVEKILNDDQLEKWEEMKEEAQMELRSRFNSRRSQ